MALLEHVICTLISTGHVSLVTWKQWVKSLQSSPCVHPQPGLWVEGSLVHSWCSRGSHSLLQPWALTSTVWLLPGLPQAPGNVCVCVSPCLCLFCFFSCVWHYGNLCQSSCLSASGNSRHGSYCHWHTSSHLISLKLGAQFQMPLPLR